MTLSEMSSKEKTVVAILGVVIIIALVGIGFLVARLVTGGQSSQEADAIQVPATSQSRDAEPDATNTLVPPPEAGAAAKTVPDPAANQAEAVVREEGIAPGLPVLLVGQPLDANRTYRLEVATADGSSATVSGSWSQTAMNAKGEVDVAASERIEGTTPIVVDIKAPVANPKSWILSASVGPKDLLAKSGPLVIILWDVTGSE
ncbi:hypothetical protein ACFLT5_03775 [Chloroflexota bacterium]